MTRLDSVIRRLTAQRDLLDWASRNIDPYGFVLELGLGNGRTYDHLRSRLPNREIYVFERLPAAHPDCLPPSRYLIVGDIFETLPTFIDRFGEHSAALIHADIGSGDEKQNRELALQLSPILEKLLQPGGLMLGDRGFVMPQCTEVTGEVDIPKGRYFAYRRKPDSRPASAQIQTIAR